MRYVRVLVERDERLKIPKVVAPWVVPILAFIHGEEKVIVTQEDIIIDHEAPDAASEYDRLQRCYGADVKTEKHFVAEIYGQPPRGVKELQRAIDEAATPEEQYDYDPTA